MSRRRLRAHATESHSASRVPAVSIPLQSLLEKLLIGAFATLMASRPLVSGDDPGRLRLTSSSGPLTFNLCLFLVLIAYLTWRVFDRRARSSRFDYTPLLLAGVGVVSWISSMQGNRYVRPGMYVGWEWMAVAVAYYLARRLMGSIENSRSLLNVIVASVVSVAGLSIYQSLSPVLGLPSSEITVPSTSDKLVGDPEFFPEMSNPRPARETTRGTYDSPSTLLGVLLLVWPVTFAIGIAGRKGPYGYLSLSLPFILAIAVLCVMVSYPAGASQGWLAALKLIEAHSLFGVGPGNFAQASHGISSPQSGWFGMAATIGLFGFLLFILAWLPLIFSLRHPPVIQIRETIPSKPKWEYYYAGLLGLLVGLIWSVSDELPAEAPTNQIYVLGAKAIGRALLWFATFALLESIRISPRLLSRVLIFGAGIVLCYGLLSDALRYPTLLIPLWVLLALARNFRDPATPIDSEVSGRQKQFFALAAIVALALTITYVVKAAMPGWSTSLAVSESRIASRFFLEEERQLDLTRPGPERANSLTRSKNFLIGNIVNPLREASERDPNHAGLHQEIARWRRSLWQLQLVADPKNAVEQGKNILAEADRADRLDPLNPAGKMASYEALLLFLKQSSVLTPERITAIGNKIEQISEVMPTREVSLRYRFVQVLLDRVEIVPLEKELGQLLRLDRLEGHGHLEAKEKADLIERSRKVVVNPPKELLEEWTGTPIP